VKLRGGCNTGTVKKLVGLDILVNRRRRCRFVARLYGEATKAEGATIGGMPLTLPKGLLPKWCSKVNVGRKCRSPAPCDGATPGSPDGPVPLLEARPARCAKREKNRGLMSNGIQRPRTRVRQSMDALSSSIPTVRGYRSMMKGAYYVPAPCR